MTTQTTKTRKTKKWKTNNKDNKGKGIVFRDFKYNILMLVPIISSSILETYLDFAFLLSSSSISTMPQCATTFSLHHFNMVNETHATTQLSNHPKAEHTHAPDVLVHLQLSRETANFVNITCTSPSDLLIHSIQPSPTVPLCHVTYLKLFIWNTNLLCHTLIQQTYCHFSDRVPLLERSQCFWITYIHISV